MQATLPLPFRIPVVAFTFLPHSASADFSSTRSSSISINTGSGDLPAIIIASYPAFFSSGPNEPPQLESKIVPVKGDFVDSETLPEAGVVVPVNGPAANTSRFSGDRASTRPASYNSFAPSPRPPR